MTVNTTGRSAVVCFGARGRVLIPRWLRKEFEIDEGTRAHVYAEGDHIVLKPITPKYLKTLRGSLKGTGAFEELMEDRKREREL